MTCDRHPPASNTHNTIALWLFTCCGLVFLMVMVGAVTRLTESGLSIAEWKPLIGAVPPLSDAEWNRVFDLYKETPEFRTKNAWMELADFRNIFFWEWAHRFLGRLIGLVYGLPLLVFWLRGKIPPGYKLKLLLPFFLGGLQGAMGWYMVQSGLVDIPAVSHYRLAAHLLLAFLIFCVMLWLGLSLNKLPPPQSSPHMWGEEVPKGQVGGGWLFLHGCLVLLLVVITICWGAFTAGLDGGLIYNDSFPKMGGAWIPPEARQSVLNNPAGVQFLHRWLAMATVAITLSFWLHGILKRSAFPALHALAAMAALQMGLGIATLLSGVSLPIAVLHQAGALGVLMLLAICLHRLYPVKTQPDISASPDISSFVTPAEAGVRRIN